MSENSKNVRMARPDETGDTGGQGHTIVGGRPSGATDRGRGIPRGMELLLKRAAVDSAFRADLLARRARVADELNLPLDRTERSMLDGIPEAQLRGIITATPVPEPQRKLLSGASAAAMLALLAQLTFTPVTGHAETAATTETGDQTTDDGSLASYGIRPGQLLNPDDGTSADDGSDRMTRGIRPDFPMPPGGIRPDSPRPPRPNPQPVPTPVPVAPEPPATASPAWKAGDPLTLEALRLIPVNTDVAGRPFADALDRIAADTDTKITLIAGSVIDTSRSVGVTTTGLSLGKALRNLCNEAAGDAALYEIEIGDTEIRLRFRSRTGATGSPQQIQPPAEPDDAGITRGIRPDIPGFDE